jgi:hypothetical protein
MSNPNPKRALLALLLSVFAAAAVAQPITRVYRVDVVPPDRAFQQGFDSRGYRMDLLAHAIGGACDEADPDDASVWVSTTDDRRQADRFAAGQLAALHGNVPDPVVWLYTIRPDQHFVSIPAALQQAIHTAELIPNAGYSPDDAHVLRWIRARSNIDVEREAVTHVVDPRTIVEAVPMRYVGSALVPGEPVRNPAYVDIVTSVPPVVDNITSLIPRRAIHMRYFDEPEPSCSMRCDASWFSPPSPMSAQVVSKDYCVARSKRFISPLLQQILLD